MSLFRPEVIKAKRGEALGTILIATPLSRWVLSLLAVLLGGAILTLL